MPSKNPGSWLIHDMITTRETQGKAVVVMQYIFLAGIAIGLIGSVIRLVRPQ